MSTASTRDNFIELVETKDTDLIKEIFTDPIIYEAMKTPDYPEASKFEPNLDDDVIWMVIRSENKNIGLLLLDHQGKEVWEGHIGLLPEHQSLKLGPRAISLGTKYLFKQKGAHTVYSAVVPDRKRVLKILSKLGWRFLGVQGRDNGFRILMGVTNDG